MFQDELGRHMTGASFQEIGLEDRRHGEWELGMRIGVNEEGRLSKAMTTPAASKLNFGTSGSSERHGSEEDGERRRRTESESTEVPRRPFIDPPMPPLELEEPRDSFDSDRDRSYSTREGSVPFPTTPSPGPSPSRRFFDGSFGSRGLSPVSESEDETEEEEEEDDDSHSIGTAIPHSTLSRPHAPIPLTHTPSPTDWTVSSAGPSHFRDTSALRDGTEHSQESTFATSVHRPFTEGSLNPSASSFGAADDDWIPAPSLEEIPNIPDEDSTFETVERPFERFPVPPKQEISPHHELGSKGFSWKGKRKHIPPPLATTPLSSTENTPLQPLPHPTKLAKKQAITHELDLSDPAGYEPTYRPSGRVNAVQLAALYETIRERRSELKKLNAEIGEAQSLALADIADGKGGRGFLLAGRGVGRISGVERILGRTKDDILWRRLFTRDSSDGHTSFYLTFCLITGITWILSEFAYRLLARHRH